MCLLGPRALVSTTRALAPVALVIFGGSFWSGRLADRLFIRLFQRFEIELLLDLLSQEVKLGLFEVSYFLEAVQCRVSHFVLVVPIGCSDALVQGHFDLTLAINQTELLAPLAHAGYLAVVHFVVGLGALDLRFIASLSPLQALFVGSFHEDQSIEARLLWWLVAKAGLSTGIELVDHQLLPAFFDFYALGFL